MLQFLLYNTYATSNISTKPLPVQNDISVSLHQTQGEEQVKVLRWNPKKTRVLDQDDLAGSRSSF